MPSPFRRDIEFYVDAAGRSEVAKQIAAMSKEDARGFRALQRAFRILRQCTLEEALRKRLVKKPTATIYVLRVQSGPVSYRLPFFEPLCRGGKIIVFTHCERRANLRPEAYKRLIEDAERRRVDWIRRNCPKE